MGLEILRHCPAHLRRDLHAIFVPIGGGGDSLVPPPALSVLASRRISRSTPCCVLQLCKKALHMRRQ